MGGQGGRVATNTKDSKYRKSVGKTKPMPGKITCRLYLSILWPDPRPQAWKITRRMQIGPSPPRLMDLTVMCISFRAFACQIPAKMAQMPVKPVGANEFASVNGMP